MIESNSPQYTFARLIISVKTTCATNAKIVCWGDGNMCKLFCYKADSYQWIWENWRLSLNFKIKAYSIKCRYYWVQRFSQMYKLAKHDTKCTWKFPFCTLLINSLLRSKVAFNCYSHILVRPSCWWNCKYLLLRLSSFIQNASGIHECCNRYQCVSVWAVVCWKTISQFTYPFF